MLMRYGKSSSLETLWQQYENYSSFNSYLPLDIPVFLFGLQSNKKTELGSIKRVGR